MPKPQSKEEGHEIPQNPPSRKEENILRESSDSSSSQAHQEVEEANRLPAAASNLDHITEESVRDFDFSTVILSKDSVNKLFERIGVFQLQNISKANLALLAPYFSETHWGWMSDKQVKEFDFSKVPLSKEIINKVFSFEGLPTKASLRIPSISRESLAAISPYFSYQHWGLLSDQQIGNFDFSRLQGTDKEKQNILENLFLLLEEHLPMLTNAFNFFPRKIFLS
ncbi:MAG: hypothetical protein HWD61_13545 [Parachlamydiaceae bacterium]|nr:MAG: hypothetical protein HWD61_13545 [Parachlamydiaceae bacterium]